ncbi:peptidogalycan biosysnthesis protein [Nocardia sp. CA-120079]|uniref:peptidogalycan biosysnthesis protein n=1 Tax=Nocardia sp. CA-120079 TaxID=3239974 RepID=UPI003D96DA3E
MIGRAVFGRLDESPERACAAASGRFPTRTRLHTAVATLDSVTAGNWDSLVQSGDLFCSYRWLRHLDTAVAPHRVVAVRAADRLVAAAPVWEGEQTPGLFHLPDFFPGVTGPWREPFVWLGARRSVRNGLICVPDSMRASALRRMLAACRYYAREHRRAGVIMPYLPLAAARELAASNRSARLLVHAADAMISVPPDGTTGLLMRANGHHRKRRRRELREFGAAGYELEWSDLTPQIAAAIAPLIANTRRKYGAGDGVSWMHTVFAAQREVGLLDTAKAVLCRRHGEVVAAAVCYRHGTSLHGRYFGAAEQADRDGAYFVTTCVAPVDYAARNGLERVHLSTSSLQAKISRGASLQPLAAVVLLARGALDPAQVRAHNRRTVLGYHDRYAAVLGPEWADLIDESLIGEC